MHSNFDKILIMNLRIAGSILGFFMFVIGALAVILSIVNVSLSFLQVLEKLGFMWAFIIKGLICVTGVLLMYLTRQNYDIRK